MKPAIWLTRYISPPIKPQTNMKSTSAFAGWCAFILLLLFCFSENATGQSNYMLRSPDQKLEVRIRTAERIVSRTWATTTRQRLAASTETQS